jgi:hypothetical protein
MNLRVKHFLVTAVAITIIGAGGVGCKDKIHESIRNLVDDFFELLDQRRDIECDCWEDHDYASRVDCLDDYDARQSARQCVKDVLVDNETTARDHLKCINNAEAAYNRCLEDRDCDDSEATGNCLDYYDDEESACPYLPEDVGDAADACWTSEP